MALLVSNFAKLWGEKKIDLLPLTLIGAIEAQQSEEAQAPVNTDEEFVSLQTVRKRLKVQESIATISVWFGGKISHGESRWYRKLCCFDQGEFGVLPKDIEELKPLASKLEEINNEIDQLNSDLSEQELKAEYLENQSRRNNIRVKGIPESEKETWEEVESKVKDAIKIKLDLEVDIERGHRVE